MKTYVFLLLFGFIQLVFCDCNQVVNITDYESYPVCPVNLFRRKRSNSEYTRWRGNQDLTTNEFLVQVLDDLTTSHKQNKIVAVNIQPFTEGGEKIIIGGAKVPPPTTPLPLSTTDAMKDYTRFAVPKTATSQAGELYLAPVTAQRVPYPVIQPVQPQGMNVNRNSQRDDSPPASPQFLARTPTLTGRQYAPIAPVAFNRRPGILPVTPSITYANDMEFATSTVTNVPSRTTHYLNIPTRSTTQVDKFLTINAIEEGTLPTFREVITVATYSIPERTITPAETNMMNNFEADIETETTTEQKLIVEDTRRYEEVLKKVAEKDSEPSYNMMLYNDEDASRVKPKEDQDISDVSLEDSTEHGTTDSGEQEVDYSEPKNTSFIKDISNEKYGTDSDKSESANVVDVEIKKMKERKEYTYSDTPNMRPFCTLFKLRPFSFSSPRTLPEITSKLKDWAETSPIVTWIDITYGNSTTMENPIYLMKVDDPSSGQAASAKLTVMIVAGIQGRDHHAVTAAMYVLYQLIEQSPAHADLLSKYRFWIIPVFNPDGYDYSMTFPQRREWAKNLRQVWESCQNQEECKSCELHGLRCLIQPCYGVNLDRNFEYQWMPADESGCGSLYSGVRQLSEVETRAITQYMHNLHRPIDTFIAYKEGEVLGVMYPYSHTKKSRAFDEIYRKRASNAATAAYSISNRPYMAGQTSEFLPLYAGGIEDWMYSHLDISYTYTIVLFRPSDSAKAQLLTERVVQEAYAATDTLLLQSTEESDAPVPAVPPRVALKRYGMRRRSAKATNTSPTHLLTIFPIVTVLYGQISIF